MSVLVITITLEALKAKSSPIVPAREAKVRIYSREHHCWWRANGSGYSTDIAEAGIYTFEDAFARSHHCGPEKGIEYEVLPPEPPPLPIIHPPRSSDEPSGRGPEGECLCNDCRHWGPLITHIRAQLDERGQELLNELVDYYGNVEMDLDVANAKLDGSWPGWEAMKGFKPSDNTP